MPNIISNKLPSLSGRLRELPPHPGKVFLIGAGPGRPDLITVRGLQALRETDVFILDYLLSAGFLQALGVDTAGKTVIQLASGKARLSQEKIHALLLRYAALGKNVARVKSGDPMIFGRGNEEAEFLTEHEIAWEVVPGISIGAALSGLDIPLTYRNEARSFAFVSARSEGGPFNTQLPKADTLVVFMGVRALALLRERLMVDGWSLETAVAIVQSGTHAWERRVFSTLADIEQAAQRNNVSSPAIVIVGKAAARDHRFQKRPTVLFTGLDATQFRALGNIIHWPAQQELQHAAGYGNLPRIFKELEDGQYESIVFTSKQGVKTLVEAALRAGKDTRLLAKSRLFVDGRVTADELARHSLRADFVAPSAQRLVDVLRAGDSTGSRRSILLVEGTHAPGTLTAQLSSLHVKVDRLQLIDLVPHPKLGQQLPEHDAIYFVSPAAVRIYWQTYGAAAFQREVWTLGPAVTRAVRRLGFSPHIIENTAALAVA